MQALAAYLNVDRKQEYVLSSLEDSQLDGSCEWFTNKDTFQDWVFSDKSPRYFWLTGKPATGKSILASHVINYLEGDRSSYYFFKHGDHQRSSLSGLFRHIAYQMAETSSSVREKLLEISQHDSHLDKEDYRTIWRKVFVSGIFRTMIPQPYAISLLVVCLPISLTFSFF
jgi:hypothetical protein